MSDITVHCHALKGSCFACMLSVVAWNMFFFYWDTKLTSMLFLSMRNHVSDTFLIDMFTSMYYYLSLKDISQRFRL